MVHDEQRRRSEQLLMRVTAEVVGEADASVVAESSLPDFLARARLDSRRHPARTVVVNLSEEWLEAVFVMQHNVGIAIIDDLRADEAYAAARLRELLVVVVAYLRGEGTVGSRWTVRGRRPVLRIRAGGQEWVAR